MITVILIFLFKFFDIEIFDSLVKTWLNCNYPINRFKKIQKCPNLNLLLPIFTWKNILNQLKMI